MPDSSDDATRSPQSSRAASTAAGTGVNGARNMRRLSSISEASSATSGSGLGGQTSGTMTPLTTSWPRPSATKPKNTGGSFTTGSVRSKNSDFSGTLCARHGLPPGASLAVQTEGLYVCALAKT